METSHAMDSRLVADQSGAPASGACRGRLRHGSGLRRVRGGIVTFGQACALALFGTVALAQEPPAPLPKIASFIHVFGCPRATHDDITNNDIFIIFVDGKTVHLKESGLTNTQLAELAALIGDVKGFNVKYECVVRT